MEINKLKVFADLAGTLNFSHTAENLFITQSSVSKQINSLEKELGHKLFNRNNQQVRLTEAGAAILPNCQQILRQDELLNKKLQQLDQHKQTTIKLAAIPTFSTYHIFQTVLQYMNAHPEIDFQLQETENQAVLTLLKNKQVDLAFYRQLNQRLPVSELDCLLFRQEAFTLCVAEDDPLAKRKLINLTDISGESFIMLNKSSQLYQPVEELCRRAGFKPNVVFTSERISSILEMIKQHQGVAILMKPDHSVAGVKFIKIFPTQVSHLYLLRQKGKHYPELAKFWRYLGKYAITD